MKAKYLLPIMLVLIMLASSVCSARNLTVTVVNPADYSSIWLGISTGGYELIAEQNKDYQFDIFVKNGMNNRSLNNLLIIPSTLPFRINSMKPEAIDQLKPMEIQRFIVNVTIPNNATIGKYKIEFDVASNEFPIGVFKFSGELKVVKSINWVIMFIESFFIILVLVLLVIRKLRINNEAKNIKHGKE
jgi:uncharacterized membrane protein